MKTSAIVDALLFLIVAFYEARTHKQTLNTTQIPTRRHQ